MTKTFTAPMTQTNSGPYATIIAASALPYSVRPVATPSGLIKLVDGTTEGKKIPFIDVVGTNTNTPFIFQIWKEYSPTEIIFIAAYLVDGTTATTVKAPPKKSIELFDMVLMSGEALWVGSSVVDNPINAYCPAASYE